MGETGVGHSDGWSVLDRPARVEQVIIDFRFGLRLDDTTLIVIGSPFTAIIDGAAVRVDPEMVQTVGDALSLVHRTIVQVVASTAGALRVEFSDGGVIDVAPDAANESWELTTADGSQLIGLPGGGVASFPPAK